MHRSYGIYPCEHRYQVTEDTVSTVQGIGKCFPQLVDIPMSDAMGFSTLEIGQEPWSSVLMNDDFHIGISVEAVKGCYVAIWRISHIGLTV